MEAHHKKIIMIDSINVKPGTTGVLVQGEKSIFAVTRFGLGADAAAVSFNF
jgi:hypothetical protein